MVIINKPKAKRFRQERNKRSFVKVLAVVLTLVMLLASVVFAIPTISALKCSYFTHQETIYIDISNVSGWSGDSAKIRVYSYYGDSDNNWNVENNKDDSECKTNACYKNAIVPSKLTDTLYSFNIQGDKVGYVKVMRLDPDMTTEWNTTGFVYNKDRSGSQNCIKLNNWDDSYQWTTYTASGGTGYQEVNAAPDAVSITNNSNIFPIDATFYDYYTDTEVQSGWGNINYVNSHGDWEPYTTLNNKIAAASSGVKYPMYFGNFFDKNDYYTGAGSSNMVNFSNWVNNSSRLTSPNYSVVGLTGPNLVNGDLYYAVNGGGNSSKKVPFFDKSFLENNDVGAVVNTKFPMRKDTSNGVTTYRFDSSSSASNGGDNAWFSADKKTMYYGAGTSHGAKDALYYYSNPQTASGYGFFPFDSNRGADKEAYDFGFGMRVDVKFNLGADDSSHIGQIKGSNGSYVNQVFNFTGDDDVWVYVDGKLILDLGGDHKKANGSIDFHNRSVSVTTGTATLNNATRNTSFTLDNYGDPTAEHTLTMFYVERGMVESNLSFNFNFAPVGNELIVDKTVNTEKINTGLKSAVAAADTFTFNQPTANGKVSSKGTISNSQYTLKNGQSISFKDQFNVPTSMTVTETESSPLDYTTSWKAVDLVLKGKGKTENEYTIKKSNTDSKEAKFTYQTKDTTSDFAMTRVQLSYENTPTIASVEIKKTVTGLSTGETDNTEFDGKVEVSLDGGSTWAAYPLQYTISGSTTSYTLSNAGKLASGAKLRNNRTLTFTGIPQGAKVRFKEDDATDGEHSCESVTGRTSGIQVRAGENLITVTNKKLKPNEITVQLNAHKTLQNANLTNGAFEFELYWEGELLDTQTCDENGDVTFDVGPYDNVATDTFTIKEKVPATKDNDIQTYDTRTYTAEVKVTKSGLNLTSDVTYKLGSTTVSNPEFVNTVKPGEIYIVKEDNAGNDVTGAQFAVYKVNSNVESLTGKAPFKTASTATMNVPYTAGTKSKTAVHFTNLPLYADNKYHKNQADKQYQWYAIAETNPKTGYFKNSTVYYFQLPVSGSYTPKYEYVNGHILSPNSGFGGMFGYKMIGIYAICFAALLGAAYVLYTKRNKIGKPAHYRAKNN